MIGQVSSRLQSVCSKPFCSYEKQGQSHKYTLEFPISGKKATLYFNQQKMTQNDVKVCRAWIDEALQLLNGITNAKQEDIKAQTTALKALRSAMAKENAAHHFNAMQHTASANSRTHEKRTKREDPSVKVNTPPLNGAVDLNPILDELEKKSTLETLFLFVVGLFNLLKEQITPTNKAG